ncbi:MAG: hypothetical protein O7E54_02060 [Planctomycetota bacterium]|nr:hypothetical protein [Planctomycetota bacterium]
MRLVAFVVPVGLLLAAVLLAPREGFADGRAAGLRRKPDPGCISCHGDIEVMHPWDPLSCTQCHGGDGKAMDKEKAHVRPTRRIPNDERTVPLRYDLAYRQFLNPTDLRVVDKTCGRCHDEACANLKKSLHGTTAGHLSDGLYENGVTRSKKKRYSIFAVKDDDGDVPEHGYKALSPIPLPAIGDGAKIGAHFSDLPRKSCMHCHLYSRGFGVRGRLGQDGWYRAEGCAACHVPYAHDGLSQSADRSLDKLEPGHPVKHKMTSRIPTETCTTCHALDANIGMSFRGLAQLPPGVPGGPDVPGTTNQREKGQFFLNDPRICPPDVHHERGMHCIDCHNATDVMGDGNIYGEMEYAVAVSCETCHGTFTEKATFKNDRGEVLEHLSWDGDTAVLRSRVTGKTHKIKQVVDVLTPGNKHYNARAKAAMTATHGRLTCYACHSGWSVNFFGFHFDRNESFTQLDILTGRRTPGRVTTQEKIFATFNNYYLGWNSEGKIAPYMVGFSTTGTFRDKDGKILLRQALPETAAGLSGMTLIHHQLHTVRPAARRCRECHGAPAVLGLGSENFQLFRDLFVVVGDAGLTVCAMDVKNPAQSLALNNVPLPSRPRDVALLNDTVSGRVRMAYVACRDGKVHCFDLSDPVRPTRTGSVDPKEARRLEVREGVLFVAAGREGLWLYSLANPRKPAFLSRVKTSDARGVHVDGLHAYVADGPAGLRIVDVSVPRKPAVTSVVDLNRDDPAPLDANDVLVHFSSAKPDIAGKRRTLARNIVYVADGRAGLYVVDVTQPQKPLAVIRRDGRRRNLGFSATGLAFASSYDIGSEGGDIPSRERDYLYVVGTATNSNGILVKIDVTNPLAPQPVGQRRTVNDPRAVRIARVFQAPFLKQYAIVVGRGRGDVEIADVTGRGALPQAGVVAGVGPSIAVDCESMPLDRLIGFDGKPLKDVSHEGARFFTMDEIARILRAEVR